MKYLEDSIVLLLYCLFSIQYTEITLSLVLAFLCALILCCIGYFTEYDFHASDGRLHLSKLLSGVHLQQNVSRNDIVRWIFPFLYMTAALYIPPFFFFFPATMYIVWQDRRYILLLYGMCIYLYHFSVSADHFLFPVFFGLFGFLLAYLLQSRTEQYHRLDHAFRHSQDDSRERNLLLSEKNKSLQEKQNYEIYTATLKERNRIAREIHDNVGHVLSRSILLVAAIKTMHKESSLDPLLNSLDDSLNSAMDSIRSSVHDLHDESVNLEEVIRSLIQEFTLCPIEFQYDMGKEVPKDVKYCLISILKEALANIIRHSNATLVKVTVREHPALYQMRIEDNGNTSVTAGTGIGLTNMQDRVHALNGNFQIMTDQGFQIFITIPKVRG